MSRKDQSPPPRSPGREQKGYQPRPTAPGSSPNPQGGHQPTGHNAPAGPPSNPPNQGSGGKK